MDEKINVNLATDKGYAVLTVLHGNALPMYHPANYRKEGTLVAPAIYIDKNFPDLQEGAVYSNSIIEVNMKQNTIYFLNDKTATCGKVEIIGKLIPNPDLEIFNINEESRYTQRDVTKILRSSAKLFADVKQVQDVIKVLKDLQFSTEEIVKDSKDGRGNVDMAFQRVVKEKSGLLPEYLELDVPLYEGTGKIKLRLEIEVDIQNRAPVYSFYCLEYDILMEMEKDKAFKDAITERMMKNFTILPIS